MSSGVVHRHARGLPRLRAHARLPEFLVAALPALLAIVLAVVLRHQLVEPLAIAHTCQATPWEGTCALRTLLVEAFRQQGIGWVALVLALAALLVRRRALAALALALAGAGLVLYSAEPSSAATVVALLVLARR